MIGVTGVLVGEATISAELFEVTRNANALVYFMPLLAILIVFLATRHLVAAMITLPASLIAILAANGALGWLGVPITPINSIVAFLLIPIGSAMVIHARNVVARNSGSEKTGFYLAGLTTALGFGATAYSSVPDLMYMGISGVVGVSSSHLVHCCIGTASVAS